MLSPNRHCFYAFWKKPRFSSWHVGVDYVDMQQVPTLQDNVDGTVKVPKVQVAVHMPPELIQAANQEKNDNYGWCICSFCLPSDKRLTVIQIDGGTNMLKL